MDISTMYMIVTGIGGILLGVISYFLKRTISLVDRCEKDIKELDATKVSEKDFASFRSETKEKFNELTGDIKDIRADYITKDDFVREIANVNRQLETIRDILLERKGKTNG